MAIQLTEREAQAFFAQIKRPLPSDPDQVHALGLSAVAGVLDALIPRPEADMKTEAFLAWMERHKMSDVEAAEALGCHRNTIRAYRTREKTIPKYIALACAAHSHGLPPMGER